jgi:hypothetical protein
VQLGGNALQVNTQVNPRCPQAAPDTLARRDLTGFRLVS